MDNFDLLWATMSHKANILNCIG